MAAHVKGEARASRDAIAAAVPCCCRAALVMAAVPWLLLAAGCVAGAAAAATPTRWPDGWAGPGTPHQMACGRGSTVCTAAYSGNGHGCCPYDGAVCCPNEQTCCPAGTRCNDTGEYLTQCVPQGGSGASTAGLSVCKPGAAAPPSKSLPNVLIIGDSVSIGYTPPVAAGMAEVALVQHSPWDTRDGGAEETAYGVQCLKYFLRSPLGVPLKPDVIMFNWVRGQRWPTPTPPPPPPPG